MPTTYELALNELCKISKSGSKPGLSRIKKLLAKLNFPQKKFKCIIVAGTNGKGSTTKYLSEILYRSGHKTGSFYSPHILSFRERIQINSINISKKDFAKTFFEVYEKSKTLSVKPTFFEVICVMAFLYFAQKNCDYAVLETGMGGRLDATNVCESELSIITNISLEHTSHLGDTLEKIALEKAGIMRAKKPIICGATGIELSILKKIAKEKNAKFFSIKNKFKIKKQIANKTEVLYSLKTLISAKLNSSANYQAKNSACAVYAAQLLGIDNSHIIHGLQSISLPARWQTISKNPKTIIDCAHNSSAFLEVELMLKKEFSRGENIVLFSAMKDKNYFAELKILSKYFDEIVLCTPNLERAQNVKTLESFAKKSGFKRIHSVTDANNAYLFAKKLCAKKEKLLIIGSIYLLQELFSEKEIRISG